MSSRYTSHSSYSQNPYAICVASPNLCGTGCEGRGRGACREHTDALKRKLGFGLWWSRIPTGAGDAQEKPWRRPETLMGVRVDSINAVARKGKKLGRHGPSTVLDGTPNCRHKDASKNENNLSVPPRRTKIGRHQICSLTGLSSGTHVPKTRPCARLQSYLPTR